MAIFMKYCFAVFDVAIWTASEEVYAKSVVDWLFGVNNSVKFVLTRQNTPKQSSSCYASQHDYHYIKPLTIVEKMGYDLDNVMIVDDTPDTWALNPGCAIPIKSWTGGVRDNELEWLILHLNKIHRSSHISTENWRTSAQEILTLDKKRV